MSKYVRNIRFETEFDGDQVVIVMKPLKFADLVLLSASISGGETELVNEFIKLLPKYIVSIEGLTDDEGQPVTATELGDSYFAALTAQAAVKCITASSPPNPHKPVDQ